MSSRLVFPAKITSPTGVFFKDAWFKQEGEQILIVTRDAARGNTLIPHSFSTTSPEQQGWANEDKKSGKQYYFTAQDADGNTHELTVQSAGGCGCSDPRKPVKDIAAMKTRITRAERKTETASARKARSAARREEALAKRQQAVANRANAREVRAARRRRNG